jgi:hypothetical protein
MHLFTTCFIAANTWLKYVQFIGHICGYREASIKNLMRVNTKRRMAGKFSSVSSEQTMREISGQNI